MPAPAPSPPPPPRPLTDIEKMAKANAVPCNPPRGEPEPWRQYVDENGTGI
jgi:hypothetical protein